jgi:hypothetical protein
MPEADRLLDLWPALLVASLLIGVLSLRSRISFSGFLPFILFGTINAALMPEGRNCPSLYPGKRRRDHVSMVCEGACTDRRLTCQKRGEGAISVLFIGAKALDLGRASPTWAQLDMSGHRIIDGCSMSGGRTDVLSDPAALSIHHTFAGVCCAWASRMLPQQPVFHP